jgi:hypothetical protein
MTIEATLDGNAAFSRLKLPRHFHQISSVATILYVAHALAFFLIPAAVAFAVVDIPASAPARVAMALVLGVIAGHGMHLLTFVGHEGMHTNLHRNKYVSAALALICSSLVPGFLIVGFSMTHWKHHRYTGQDIDPDVQIYSQYRTFWSRFFLALPGRTDLYEERRTHGRWPSVAGEHAAAVQRARNALDLADQHCTEPGCGDGLRVHLASVVVARLHGHADSVSASTCSAPSARTSSTRIPCRGVIATAAARRRSTPRCSSAATSISNTISIRLCRATGCRRSTSLMSQGLLAAARAPVEPSFFGALRYRRAVSSIPASICSRRPTNSSSGWRRGHLDREAASMDAPDADALIAVMRK